MRLYVKYGESFSLVVMRGITKCLEVVRDINED